MLRPALSWDTREADDFATGASCAVSASRARYPYRNAIYSRTPGLASLVGNSSEGRPAASICATWRCLQRPRMASEEMFPMRQTSRASHLTLLPRREIRMAGP